MNTAPTIDYDDGPNRDRGTSAGGWWRRNSLPLLALLILAAATPAAMVGLSLRRQRQSSPTEPIVVEAGQSAEYGPATVGPAKLTELDDDVGAPPNTRVVEATIGLRNATWPLCPSPSLVETTGAQRRFTRTSLLNTGGVGNPCAASADGSVEMLLTYVVPADATGPFAIEFVAIDEAPRYLEFKVQR